MKKRLGIVFIAIALIAAGVVIAKDTLLKSVITDVEYAFVKDSVSAIDSSILLR